jgi:hypothetical protein
MAIFGHTKFSSVFVPMEDMTYRGSVAGAPSIALVILSILQSDSVVRISRDYDCFSTFNLGMRGCKLEFLATYSLFFFYFYFS